MSFLDGFFECIISDPCKKSSYLIQEIAKPFWAKLIIENSKFKVLKIR